MADPNSFRPPSNTDLTPDSDTLTDYDLELSRLYSKANPPSAPRISDPELAHGIANELMNRLVMIDMRYDMDLKLADREDDPLVAKEKSMVARDAAIRKCASFLEFQHRLKSPDDFAEEQKHYLLISVDPALRQHFNAAKRYQAQKALSELGAEIDAMGIEEIVLGGRQDDASEKTDAKPEDGSSADT